LRRAVAKLVVVLIAAVIIVAGAAGAAYYLNIASKPAITNYTVIYADSSPMTTLDPSTEFSNSIAILPNVYETLTYYNDSTGSVSPLLATGWSSTSNGTQWTFHLRQGVTFHDGTSFNATAVVYSVNRTQVIGGGAAYIWAPVNKVKAIDTYDVWFNLSYAANLPLIASAGYAAYIMSPNIQSIYHPSGNLSDWFNAGHDDGTGPYIVKSWQPQTQVVLTKFDKYWRGWSSNQYSTAVIKIVADATTREQMVESESAIASLLPSADIANLQSNSKVKVYIGPSYQNLIAQFNTAKPPLNNVLVRRALSYSIPYQQVVQNVMLGYATQSVGVVPKGMFGHNDSLFQYTYDLNKAADLLAQAGYSAQYTNGTLVGPANHPLPTLQLTYTSGDPNEAALATLWTQSLAKIGVTLNTQAMVWTQQWGEATGPDPQKVQDIFVEYWWPTYPTPYDWLFNLFHSESTPLFNLEYWSNSTFDHVIDTAASIEGTDRTTALHMYSQAQEMIISQAIAAFIFDEEYVYVVNSGIHGFTYNPGYTTVVWFYNLRV
jgi:peptide/nickel transport system substrate-binding protein